MGIFFIEFTSASGEAAYCCLACWAIILLKCKEE
jgi:hypothetical protein